MLERSLERLVVSIVELMTQVLDLAHVEWCIILLARIRSRGRTASCQLFEYFTVEYLVHTSIRFKVYIFRAQIKRSQFLVGRSVEVRVRHCSGL